MPLRLFSLQSSARVEYCPSEHLSPFPSQRHRCTYSEADTRLFIVSTIWWRSDASTTPLCPSPTPHAPYMYLVLPTLHSTTFILIVLSHACFPHIHRRKSTGKVPLVETCLVVRCVSCMIQFPPFWLHRLRLRVPLI